MTSAPRVRRTLPVALSLLALAFLGAPAVGGQDPGSDALQRQIAVALDRVYPALVNIGVVTRSFRGGRAVRAPSAGSGAIVTKEGHVLTNFHVAEDATRLACMLQSGEKIDADVLVHDPLTDLSVLKLRLETRKDPTAPLPVATIGDSSLLKVGDHVLALGNPGTQSNTVTLGIVANANRVFKSFTGSDIEFQDLGSGQLTGIFTNWIQHDALIQPGNSGGPLVNLEGEVIGVNELGGAGMGFAIPSNLAKWVLEQAIQHGEVRRGWIGITIHPVEVIDRTDGVLVASVLPGSPAARAGLLAGDVIVELAGSPVSVPTFEAVPGFYARAATLEPGRPVKVAWQRGGQRTEGEIPVERMQPYLGAEAAFDRLGVSAMEITPPMAISRRYPDTKGLVLTGIRPGFPAEVAKPSLDGGDVILQIGGEAVEGLKGLLALQDKFAARKDVAVRFRRGKRDMVTVLDLTKKPEDRRSAELPRPWLGAQTQVLTPEIAKALGLEGTQGFRVTWVLPGTEAEKAGLVPGDVITALNGDKLSASKLQDAEMLRRRIEDMDIGADATLSVLRDAKPVDVVVTLQETPDTAADVKRATDELLEYGVRELTYMDRVEREMPLDQPGVLVGGVEPGGWANIAGLRPGDVILSIQDAPVATLADFEKASRAIAESKPKRVKVFVRRDFATAFVFIEPDWPRK